MRTVDHIGAAVITTTLILVGRLATLWLKAMPAIRKFAELSCATLLAALCADLFLLPAMLMWLLGGPTKSQANQASSSVG